MIDVGALQRMTADGRVCFVDVGGQPIDPSAEDLEVPVLLVTPVSDAVKRLDGDRLAEDLDRSQMWLVGGIAVDGSTIDSLPDGPMEIGELIELVAGAGHNWSTTLL